MIVNYPIKYALMPIDEQVGWNNGVYGLERNYDTVCYIVSKCYVISEKTKFEPNGDTSIEYQVVFPYEYREFNRWKKVLPSRSVHGIPLNSKTVHNLFDSFEEASLHCDKKNNEIRDGLCTYIPYSDDYEEKITNILKEFDYRLANYKRLEEAIEVNTNDLKVGNPKKLKEVIKVFNNNGTCHKSLANLYETIKVLDDKKYVVFNITDENYELLSNLIDCGATYDIMSILRKSKPILSHMIVNEPVKLLNVLIPDIFYIRDNHLFCNDENIFSEDDLKNIDPETLIFLTTETTDDILKSYKVYDDIEFKYVDDEEVLKKYLVKNNKK